MKFDTASSVEQVVFELVLADWPRRQNRALINNLFNGAPPYTREEVEDGNIAINNNFLTGPELAHDCRRQFTQAFLVPDPLVIVEVDHGPAWKRQGWGMTITKELNRILRNNLQFMENERSGIAQKVLHGIDPFSWADETTPYPRSDAIEDSLVPSNTLCSMENLQFFARFRSYTARELVQQISGPNVDPGWNIPVVEAAIRWVDQQAQMLLGNNWPEVWSPEKQNERIKQDGGLYASDTVPTVDVYDLFYFDKSDKHTGWRRKMVLDVWGFPGAGGLVADVASKSPDYKRYGLEKSQFLYDSERRNNPLYAGKLEHIAQWSFADCSAVAPFPYHSVRSMGYLLYSVCHLENRLKCKFTESAFEASMQYFKINNLADAERALRVNLTDKTPLPDGLTFVPRDQRWEPPAALMAQVMQMTGQTIAKNSESFVNAFDSERGDSETATRTMAKAANSSSMISAMLGQAYLYQRIKYREICRRMCMDSEESTSVDAKKFRAACLRQGVPMEALDVERWSVEPAKIIGGGNKVMQQNMMGRIMALYFPKLDPSAQRQILRMGLAIDTDDYALANRLVPDEPQTSLTVTAAQLAAGLLLSGLPMNLEEGVNHDEFCEALLAAMAVRVGQIQSEGVPITPDEVMGLQNCAGQTIQGQPIPGGNGITAHLKILEGQVQYHVKGRADDKTLKETIKKIKDGLARIMNQVKALAEQAAEAAKKKQAQGRAPQMDPKDAAKIQATKAMAATKLQIKQQEHAVKAAQRQIDWEMKQRHADAEHAHGLVKDVHKTAVETANSRLKALATPAQPPTDGGGDE